MKSIISFIIVLYSFLMSQIYSLRIESFVQVGEVVENSFMSSPTVETIKVTHEHWDALVQYSQELKVAGQYKFKYNDFDAQVGSYFQKKSDRYFISNKSFLPNSLDTHSIFPLGVSLNYNSAFLSVLVSSHSLDSFNDEKSQINTYDFQRLQIGLPFSFLNKNLQNFFISTNFYRQIFTDKVQQKNETINIFYLANFRIKNLFNFESYFLEENNWSVDMKVGNKTEMGLFYARMFQSTSAMKMQSAIYDYYKNYSHISYIHKFLALEYQNKESQSNTNIKLKLTARSFLNLNLNWGIELQEKTTKLFSEILLFDILFQSISYDLQSKNTQWVVGLKNSPMGEVIHFDILFYAFLNYSKEYIYLQESSFLLRSNDISEFSEPIMLLIQNLALATKFQLSIDSFRCSWFVAIEKNRGLNLLKHRLQISAEFHF